MTFRMPSWPDHEACTVEVLIVPGCPGAKLTLERVCTAADELGIEVNLRVLTVDEEDAARELGFMGSPTVRVDGVDIEDAEARAQRSVGLTCRLYADGGAPEPVPPTALIRRAIAAASRK